MNNLLFDTMAFPLENWHLFINMMESRNFLRGEIFLVYLLLIWIFLSSAFLLTEVYHNFQMLSRSARQLMWQAGLRARWNLWSGPCIQIHPFTAHLLLLPFWGTGKCSKLFFIPGSINLKKKSMNWEAKLLKAEFFIFFSQGELILIIKTDQVIGR